MEEVATILPKALRRQLTRQHPPVLEVLFPLWSRVVGKLIAKHSRPAAFGNGILTLAVSSLPWVAELREMSEQICCQINRFLGSAAVRKIRVIHEPGCEAQTEIPAEPAPVNLRAEDDLTTEGVSNFLWPSGKVSIDPEMAGIVERSFVKYFSRPGRSANC